MPSWATRFTTIGQIVIVLGTIAAVTVLALEHIIDGVVAVGAIMLITGASAVVTKVTDHALPPSGEGVPFDANRGQRG